MHNVNGSINNRGIQTEKVFYPQKVFTTRNKTKMVGTPCRLHPHGFHRQREYGPFPQKPCWAQFHVRRLRRCFYLSTTLEVIRMGHCCLSSHFTAFPSARLCCAQLRSPTLISTGGGGLELLPPVLSLRHPPCRSCQFSAAVDSRLRRCPLQHHVPCSGENGRAIGGGGGVRPGHQG